MDTGEAHAGSRMEPVDQSGRVKGWLVIVVAVLGLLVVAGAGTIGWLIGSGTVELAGADEAQASDASANATVNRTQGQPLFDAPEDLQGVLFEAKRWTVTIYCAEGSGAGWIIDTPAEPRVRPVKRADVSVGLVQVVVTAEHVIRDCKESNEELEVFVGSRRVPAALMNWDRPSDVATIGIIDEAASARTHSFAPQGSWAMTLGAPLDDVIVPVIGEVVHDNGVEVLLHMTVRPGNSGGPVVNSRGEVIGTIGGTILDEEDGAPTGWSYAAPVEALCERVFECPSAGIDSD
jgi:S1-C subfamily serine protease